jgi:hypothetical protein
VKFGKDGVGLSNMPVASKDIFTAGRYKGKTVEAGDSPVPASARVVTDINRAVNQNISLFFIHIQFSMLDL